MLIRYTQWTGEQQLRLEPEKILDRLAEQLFHGGSVSQALDSMAHQGVELEDGRRIAGVDGLLKEVRQQMRRRQRDFNLKDSLTEIERNLDQLLERELKQVQASDKREPGQAPAPRCLEPVSRRLSQAIRDLEGHQFEDQQAATDFEALLQEEENIRDLENFRDRFSRMFQGAKSLGYRESVELMRQMEQLERIETSLSAGDLDAISPEELAGSLGQQAAGGLEQLRDLQAELERSGYIIEKEGLMRLSAKGARRIGELALREIYRELLKDRAGRHVTHRRGVSETAQQPGRPYVFGEPLNLDLITTLNEALKRSANLPLRLEPRDFHVFESDYATSSATVLCLDMSWSMSWEGRFAAAKKVAMALETLIRTRYPKDFFGVVGFFTRALELKPSELPEASWNIGDPFTNLQHALRLATSILDRRASRNQDIVIITDGQPTAYFRDGRLFCEWPLSFGGISARAAQETLAEVERVTRKGIRISVFMLDDSPGLRGFVDKIARINRGRALFTRPDRLGEYVLVDYVDRKNRRL
jgi:uncharacterized protein with von Willebrand factor type A (vWA) domain